MVPQRVWSPKRALLRLGGGITSRITWRVLTFTGARGESRYFIKNGKNPSGLFAYGVVGPGVAVVHPAFRETDSLLHHSAIRIRVGLCHV
jgi:hypothetical protein